MSNLDWVINECLIKVWVDVKNPVNKNQSLGRNAHRTKKVVCIEDNTVFNSISDCAVYYNVTKSCIADVCKSNSYFSKKLKKHFKYF
jgi:hypothetical protein